MARSQLLLVGLVLGTMVIAGCTTPLVDVRVGSEECCAADGGGACQWPAICEGGGACVWPAVCDGGGATVGGGAGVGTSGQGDESINGTIVKKGTLYSVLGENGLLFHVAVPPATVSGNPAVSNKVKVSRDSSGLVSIEKK